MHPIGRAPQGSPQRRPRLVLSAVLLFLAQQLHTARPSVFYGGETFHVEGGGNAVIGGIDDTDRPREWPDLGHVTASTGNSRHGTARVRLVGCSTS